MLRCRLRLPLLLGTVVLSLACGSVAPEAPPAETGTPSAQEPGASDPAPGASEAEGPRAEAYPFVPVLTTASASNYACPEEGSNDRVFLRAYAVDAKDGPFVQVSVRRDAPIGEPVALTPDGPKGVAGFAYDARGREGGGSHLGLHTVGGGASPWPTFDQARIWPEAVPATDGEPASVRAWVHFVDGRELDVTIAAPLVTTLDPCGD